MSNEAAYEAALLEVWRNLGGLAPADMRSAEKNKLVEAAYYAAENVLYKAGRIKFDEQKNLRFVGAALLNGVDHV
jgi:hypothetical protein